VRHGELVRQLAAELFPAIERRAVAELLDVVLELMLGMAVSRGVDPTPAHYRRLLDHIRTLAHAALAAPVPTGAAS
jgi:hypothetical protein